ncbi:hypothetical protein ACFVWN_29200 [Nocardiopsis flavescens]|uniref:hypothetical protein n=1 Tax=Nocardiopsis flavescens TaxID=758803 RepID=UPI00364A82AA
MSAGVSADMVPRSNTRRSRPVRPVRLTALAAAAALLAGCAGGGGTDGTGTAAPTPSPSPSEQAGPTAEGEPFGTFEEVVFEGDSAQAVELPEDVRAARAAVVDVLYEKGARELQLFTTDADGGFSSVLLDTFLPITGDDPGDFSGQVAGLVGDASATHVNVEADGAWRVTLRPVSTAPELPESGSGHGVFRYSGPGGDLGVTGSGAEGGLAVQQAAPDATAPSRAAFLEFEERAGTGSLAAGPSLVHVAHNGEWSLDLP